MARKEKMKVYHGLPKSITDNHTLFYADFDGKTPPLLYEDSKYASRGFGNPSPIGYALNKTAFYDIGQLSLGEGAFTIEFWVSNLVSGSSSDSWGGLVCIGKMYNSDYTMEKIFSLLNARSQVPNDIKLLESSKNIIHSGSLQTDSWLHIRVTYDGKQTVRGYVNGNLTGTSTISQSELEKWKAPTRYVVGLNIGHNYQPTRNSCYISDLHISNVDRGDYFPTLPQDFIDGKAIIKPRMGQQQIKGDPMYSQVTTLKVPNQPYDVMGTIYSLEEDSQGLNTCFSNPELATASAYEWAAGVGKIRIRGLNGEVISGVIDADTAIAKVLEYPHILTVKVDDVSRIKVGDTFYVYYPDLNQIDSMGVRYVERVDTNNNTVTVMDSFGWNINTTKGVAYIIETTTSSSSPTVKTQDGVEVTGTWSGLGTNSATFTIGSQSTSIVGKDLYVEYTLTMPSGNSDFPQLPHIVERAYDETGIEMKPVSEIVIVDDFRGKIALSDKACPHKMGYGYNSKLLNPSEITETKFSRYYESLSKLDGIVDSSNSETAIPQQLFSFNIIEMVERKLGCEIPSANKVQWLKDNILNLNCYVYGYGTCKRGNSSTLKSYLVDTNSWSVGVTNTSSAITKIANESTSVSAVKNSIDSNGFCHYLFITEASDGTTPSAIYTDYVSLEIKLKVDSTFTALYCENKRAREDKCNPVLIQKETKTVKRFIPSKEPFVTESLAYPNSVVSKSNSDVVCNKGLYKSPFIYLTSYGTGSQVDGSYLLGLQPIIPKLPLNPNFKEHQFALGEIPIDRLQTLPKVEKSILVKVPTMMDALPNSSNQNKFYSEGKIRDIGEQLSKDLSMAVRFGIALVEKDGEMYMKIRSCVPNSPNYAKSTILSMSTNFDMEYLYKLPTRPLIK